MKKVYVNKLALLLFVSPLLVQAAEFVPNRAEPFNASNFQADNYFDKQVADNTDVRVLPAGASTKDLNRLIEKLDDNGKKGGVIRLENSPKKVDYTFTDTVIFKSNMRIEIEGGTYIQVKDTGLLFNFGTKSKKSALENVALTSVNGQAIFDLTSYKPKARIRLAMLGNVENFYIGDFEVIDNNTVYSAISLNPVGSSGKDPISVWAKGPRDGVLQNIKQTNSHVGYGVVQVQSAKNVLFKDLVGEGGITLRLETGANLSNQMSSTVANVDGVWAQNISLSNGYKAVMFSPHGKINKDVFIDGLSTIDSTYTVAASRGFINSGKVNSKTKGPVPKGENCNIDTSIRGTYKNVRVRNIKSHRTNRFTAQVKSKDYALYELMNKGDYLDFKDMKAKAPTPDKESYYGRSINTLKLGAVRAADNVGASEDGYWPLLNEFGQPISSSDVKRTGFPDNTAPMYYESDYKKGSDQKLKKCIVNVATNTARWRKDKN